MSSPIKIPVSWDAKSVSSNESDYSDISTLKTTQNTTTKPTTKPSGRLTLKSILTGSVYQHHPTNVLDRALDAQMAAQHQHQPSTKRSKAAKTPAQDSGRLSLKSVLTGSVYQHHPSVVLERALDARSVELGRK